MKLALFVLSVFACLVSAICPVQAETIALDFALPTDAVPQESPPVAAAIDQEPTGEMAVLGFVKSDSEPEPDDQAPEVPEPAPDASLPPAATALVTKSPEAPVTPTEHEAMFAGGSESLVARTVGAAEGTRTADGHKTENYYGHTDPGDGKWNVGTFSYSNRRDGTAITTPEAADRYYLDRLHERAEVIRVKAERVGVTLTFQELLNGIDLANQAPLAVLEEAGFVERLAESKRAKGLSGQAAILESRVWAFWNPEKGGWDAPGLRAYDDISKVESIRRDQERRMLAIADALASYQQAQ
jgi:hypothetical protein